MEGDIEGGEGEGETEEKVYDDEDIARLMGFGGFNTTKVCYM